MSNSLLCCVFLPSVQTLLSLLQLAPVADNDLEASILLISCICYDQSEVIVMLSCIVINFTREDKNQDDEDQAKYHRIRQYNSFHRAF